MDSLSAQTGITRLIQHMAALTSRREEKALVQSLLEMNLQFTSATRIELYAVQQRHGQYEIRREAALPTVCAADDNWQPAGCYLSGLMANAHRDTALATRNGWHWQCIRKRDEVVSLLALEAPALNEHDRLFIRGMVRIQENFLRLLFDAERDMLTGLHNRRTLDAKLFELLTQRSGEETLAMVDVDLFKQVNDRYGHIMGDEVLLLLARKMASMLGEHDLLYRYGGEEFAILLMSAPEQAGARLDALRQAVAELPLPQVGHVTISIGFITITRQSLPAELIEEADKALYFAKANGRNRVANHAELAAAGLISASSPEGSIELF